MASTIERIAEFVTRDIQTRGLKPGDRYLTTAEIGEQFDVSPTTAHRALNILVDRDMVIRRQNRGTYVGPRMEEQFTTRIPTVCILRTEDERFHPSDRSEVDVIIAELERQMPDVNVHLGCVPARDAVDYVRALLRSLRQMGELAGVLARSCSREVYRLLADEQVPAIVMGSLYSDQEAMLPSVDGDEHQVGRLLMEYLVRRQHRRMVVFTNSAGLPGDNHFLDGASQVLTEAKLPHNALIYRQVPAIESDVVVAQVRELLEMGDRPTAIAVRIPDWVAAVRRTVEEHGLRVPDDVEIVYRDVGVQLGQPGHFPRVQPQIPFIDVAVQVARMLHRVRRGIPLDNLRTVIPYELKLGD